MESRLIRKDKMETDRKENEALLEKNGYSVIKKGQIQRILLTNSVHRVFLPLQDEVIQLVLLYQAQ